MNSITDTFKRLWNLRTSESRAARAGWWVTAFALAGLLLFRNSPAEYILVLWTGGNIAFGVISFCWILFHPRMLGRSNNTAIAWSRWLTVAAVFALYVTLSGHSHSITPGVLLLIVLAASPILFICFLMFSLFGGSLGAFLRRRNSDVEQSAIASVIAWWIAVILAIVATASQEILHMSDSIVVIAILGTPTFTILIARFLRRVYVDESRAPLRLVDAALRRLMIRVGPAKSSRTIDLRGVTIGLVAAAAALSLARPIVAPAQQSLLVSMFRLRWQIYASTQFFVTEPSGVVFVRFDTTEMAGAMTNSSEAAEQAAMIRRLERARPAVIVMPAPTVDVRLAELGDTSKAAVGRTIKDMPDLIDAVKQNGKVILTVKPEQRQSPVLAPLFAAAAGVSQFGEEFIGPAMLPSIPMKWRGDPPAPLMILALLSGHDSRVNVVKSGVGEESINTHKIATAMPDRVLIDLSTNGRHGSEDTPTFASSALMDGTATVPSTQTRSPGQSVDKYLSGKVVFLEALIHGDVDSPLGLMPRSVALASAVNALIHNDEIKPGNPTLALVWTLILGMLIGSQCVGRDPLQSSWRVAVLMLFNFGYSFAVFMSMGVWADPVLPLIAATVAFLLVTQFTFAIERDERERNRSLFSRFVAREFVDELLQSASRKLALGGDKRTVCVLFADVRNFTGFAESHRPEDVIEIMNTYLTALTDALDSYGGILDKYTGDGLMAFFEIKGDVRTELVRSVNASLAMRDAATAVSQRLKKAGRENLEIGIGMHYGEAIVGLVGNEQRQINYTALGHTVVVSARLQSLAEGGEVVVSEPIFVQVSDAFHFSAMPPVFVKGITAEQRPYQVRRSLGEGAAPY